MTKLSPRWEGPYRVVADEYNVFIAWTQWTKRSPKFPVADVLPWYDVNATDQFPQHSGFCDQRERESLPLPGAAAAALGRMGRPDRRPAPPRGTPPR